MLKKINFRLIAAVLLMALLVVAAVFVVWAENASPASDIALQALNSDSAVNVSLDSGYSHLLPQMSPLRQVLSFIPVAV